MAFNLEWATETFDQARRQSTGIRRPPDVALNDGELIAAEACNYIGPSNAFTQSICHRLQQKVTDLVAERIIDTLESIKVEAEQRQNFAAIRPRRCLPKSPLKCRPIRQVSERIVMRKICDLGL